MCDPVTGAAIAGAVFAGAGAKSTMDAGHRQQKQADKANYARQQQQQMQAEQAQKAEVAARNEQEALLEDESGGPRLRSVAQQQQQRTRRDTLTPRGLGIARRGGGSSGLNIGYQGTARA